MSAEIPWACGPGETLPPAPRRDVLLCDHCPSVAVLHVTTGAGTARACEAHKGLMDTVLCARGEAYVQACEQRDAARAELVSGVRGLTEERDRALVRAQKAEDSTRFWEHEAKAWEADWRALPAEARAMGPPRAERR